MMSIQSSSAFPERWLMEPLESQHFTNEPGYFPIRIVPTCLVQASGNKLLLHISLYFNLKVSPLIRRYWSKSIRLPNLPGKSRLWFPLLYPNLFFAASSFRLLSERHNSPELWWNVRRLFHIERLDLAQSHAPNYLTLISQRGTLTLPQFLVAQQRPYFSHADTFFLLSCCWHHVTKSWAPS